MSHIRAEKFAAIKSLKKKKKRKHDTENNFADLKIFLNNFYRIFIVIKVLINIKKFQKRHYDFKRTK